MRGETYDPSVHETDELEALLLEQGTERREIDPEELALRENVLAELPFEEAVEVQLAWDRMDRDETEVADLSWAEEYARRQQATMYIAWVQNPGVGVEDHHGSEALDAPAPTHMTAPTHGRGAAWGYGTVMDGSSDDEVNAVYGESAPAITRAEEVLQSMRERQATDPVPADNNRTRERIFESDDKEDAEKIAAEDAKWAEMLEQPLDETRRQRRKRLRDRHREGAVAPTTSAESPLHLDGEDVAIIPPGDNAPIVLAPAAEGTALESTWDINTAEVRRVVGDKPETQEEPEETGQDTERLFRSAGLTTAQLQAAFDWAEQYRSRPEDPALVAIAEKLAAQRLPQRQRPVAEPAPLPMRRPAQPERPQGRSFTRDELRASRRLVMFAADEDRGDELYESAVSWAPREIAEIRARREPFAPAHELQDLVEAQPEQAAHRPGRVRRLLGRLAIRRRRDQEPKFRVIHSSNHAPLTVEEPAPPQPLEDVELHMPTRRRGRRIAAAVMALAITTGVGFHMSRGSHEPVNNTGRTVLETDGTAETTATLQDMPTTTLDVETTQRLNSPQAKRYLEWSVAYDEAHPTLDGVSRADNPTEYYKIWQRNWDAWMAAHATNS